MTTLDLITQISSTENQELKNLLILEFTFRIYIPFGEKTFEELLVENGYRTNDKIKENTK